MGGSQGRSGGDFIYYNIISKIKNNSDFVIWMDFVIFV